MKKPKRRRKRTSSLAENQDRFWLAINGASAAVMPVPCSKVVVRPTPQMLIGYSTRDEQLKAQDLLLNAPIEEVETYMGSLQKLAKDGTVKIQTFKNPEPPVSATRWMPVG